MRALWVLLCVGIVFTLSAGAHGQDLLTSCFDAARAGNDEACGLCERAAAENEGQRRGVALLNLARCEETRGRLLEARPHYVSAKPLLPKKLEEIDAFISAIDDRIGTLRFDWSEAPAETTLRVDGTVVPAPQASLSVNPGRRVAKLSAPGHEPRTVTLTIRDGGSSTLTITLEPTENASLGPDPPPDDGSGQRIAGYVVGGVGVAGAILFAITGVMALTEQSTVDEHCPETEDGPRQCTNVLGVEAAERGETLNIINAVGLGVGVVGLTVGLTLVLTAPDAEATAALHLRPTSARLRITF